MFVEQCSKWTYVGSVRWTNRKLSELLRPIFSNTVWFNKSFLCHVHNVISGLHYESVQCILTSELLVFGTQSVAQGKCDAEKQMARYSWCCRTRQLLSNLLLKWQPSYVSLALLWTKSILRIGTFISWAWSVSCGRFSLPVLNTKPHCFWPRSISVSLKCGYSTHGHPAAEKIYCMQFAFSVTNSLSNQIWNIATIIPSVPELRSWIMTRKDRSAESCISIVNSGAVFEVTLLKNHKWPPQCWKHRISSPMIINACIMFNGN